ncbi:MAG: hypothetical protein IT427_15695 [Pirellulales bacterium]|nr:hypothetical protein [Pirellulales bacterium]
MTVAPVSHRRVVAFAKHYREQHVRRFSGLIDGANTPNISSVRHEHCRPPLRPQSSTVSTPEVIMDSSRALTLRRRKIRQSNARRTLKKRQSANLRRLLLETLEDRRLLAFAYDDFYSTDEGTLMIDNENPVINDVYNDNYGPESLDRPTTEIVQSPSHGTLDYTLQGGSFPNVDPPGIQFTYQPEAGFVGDDFFVYSLADDQSTSTATAFITVNWVNDPPVAENDEYGVAPNGSLTGDAPGVLANDADADGDPLTALAVTTGPSHGEIELNPDGSFRIRRCPTTSAGIASPTRPTTAIRTAIQRRSRSMSPIPTSPSTIFAATARTWIATTKSRVPTSPNPSTFPFMRRPTG